MSLDIDGIMNGTEVGYGGDYYHDDVTVYKEPLNENPYVFMDNAYHGTNGFRDGTYLTPHPREMFYTARRQVSIYKNYTKPILDAMVDPIFADVIPRQVEESSMFNDFLWDTDNNGTPMHSLMKNAMQICVRHGQVFIILDNFTETDMPETVLDARSNRMFPYAMIRTGADVDDYELDKWGNILSITFLDDPVKVNGQEEKRYRKWDKEASYVLKKTGDGKYEVLETTPHGLGRIPVIVAYRTYRNDKSKLLIDPPTYDIARVNCGIYNKDSEARDLERSQSFSVLVIQSDRGGNLTLGNKNVLYISPETTLAPAFISPDSSILAGLVENSEKLRDDLFRMANQHGVTAVKIESSGVAESYRFHGTETVLRSVSMIAKILDEAIFDLFSAYTGEEQDYVADYPSDFAPGNVQVEIDTIDIYLKQSPPPKAKALALKKLTRLVLADQDEEELEEALKEIEEEALKEPEPIPPQLAGETGMMEEEMGETGMGETGMMDEE